MNKIIRKTGLGSVAARIRILVISLLVMIIGLFLIYQRHQETLASTRIHASNRTRLNRYVDMMNEELTRSAVFISQQYLQQEIYIELENAGDDLSKYMCSCDVEELFQIFQTDSRYHQYIYAYCPANDVFVYSSSLSSEPPKKEDVAALAEKEFALREWQTAELNGAYCFYYTALLHETYLGVLIPVDQLIAMTEYEEGGFAVLLTVMEEQILDNAYSTEVSLSKVQSGEQETLQLHGQRFICDYAEGENGLGLIGLTDYSSTLEAYAGSIWIVLIGAVLIIAAAAVGIYTVENSLQKPLKEIETGIAELEKGNLSYQLKEQTLSEFSRITEMYNRLGGEIEQLRIDVYEEELARQKSELIAMQRQLDPHFFINCINNLKTLEMQGRHEEFQRMCTDLGTYMRATISNRTMIHLDEELRRIDTYIRLQNIRYEGRVRLKTDIFDDTFDMKIPSALIQTFVENSVKYAMYDKRTLLIRVSISLAEDDRILFRITDNGRGFPAEYLEKLNGLQQIIKDDRECIGIYNIVSRARLIYKDAFEIRFMNAAGSGASVEMKVPDYPEEEE